MAVALNQADLLAPAEVDAWRDDMARLLAEDGLHDVPIMVVSARTGTGLEDVRRLLRGRVATRRAAVERLEADVADAARALASASGSGTPAGVHSDDRARLLAALEDAAGVPVIVHAVDAAHRRRGSLATGWPFVRWIRRFRPDPLRRLRLPETPQPSVRTSRPEPTEVQRAQVATAARALAAARARRRDPGRSRASRPTRPRRRGHRSARRPSPLVARSGSSSARVRGRHDRRDALAARPRRARLPPHRRGRTAARALGRSDPDVALARRNRRRRRLRLRLQARECGKRPTPRSIRGPSAAQTDR